MCLAHAALHRDCEFFHVWHSLIDALKSGEHYARLPSGTQYFINFEVNTMATAFTQASTYKRHDVIVVMPAARLWADREGFGST